jgi:hypothetical protein
MAGAHVQIYLWTFDPGWPQQYIIQKCMSGTSMSKELSGYVFLSIVQTYNMYPRGSYSSCRNILSFPLRPLAVLARCLFCDTGNELVWLPICVCLTKDVRKDIAHSFIEIWIGWCRSTSCRGVMHVMHGRRDRRWSSGIIVCSVELYSLVECSILRHSCLVVPWFVTQRCRASRFLGTLAAIYLYGPKNVHPNIIG